MSENDKEKKRAGANVYTYTAGEYDVLADSSLEDKIEEFRKKIDQLDECYNELSKRLEALNGDGVWKSEHQKELYSYVKNSIVSSFKTKIEDWKVYKEFLITVLQNYTEFDETYDRTIDEEKAEFDVNEDKHN